MQGLADQDAQPFLEVSIVLDAELAFPDFLRPQRFGRAFALQDAGPTGIDAMALVWILMAGTVRFTAGAPRRRKASGQEWEGDFEPQLFLGLSSMRFYLNVIIH